MKEKIQIFENQIASLQERVIHLENQNLVMEEKFNMLSEAPRRSKFDISRPKMYYIITTFNKEKGLNEPNFITLGTISEQKKIEIIQTGF